jgi:hypothetical protein
VTLSIISRLRLFYLCHFSKPVADRPVYQAIRRQGPQKIVELGVGDGSRAMRMIEVAQRRCQPSPIHYVGMDLFEGRPASNGSVISLKTAHQLLRSTGARVQLVPGNPPDTLIRLANSLGKVDLLIVPAELDSPAFSRVWFFVPRMLHARSLVFVEGPSVDGQRSLRPKSRHEIDSLAAVGVGRRVA